MYNTNLVSIIIPVYNSAKYIDETIKSIEKQTYKNYEAIFIDDYSSDNSVEIIKKYQKNNSKIKIIKLKRHRGVSIARNIGIRKSKGKFLTFLDSDDLWNPKKLEKQIEFLTKNNYKFVYSSYCYVNENQTLLSKKIKIKPWGNYKKSLIDMRILTITVMLNTSKIPKRHCYMPNIMNEDIATWWKILKKGYLAYGQNEVLAYCRKRKNSRSSNKLITAKARWYIYRNVEKLSFLKSLECFIIYIIDGIFKRIYFWKKINKKLDEKYEKN